MIHISKLPFNQQSAINGNLHQDQPVFVISGCCEPAHSSPEQFEALGLEYQKNVNEFDYDYWGDADPLTEKERNYIEEDGVSFDCISEEYAYFSTNSVVLFKGKKYLFPNVEVDFNENVSDEQAAKNIKKALEQATAIASKLDSRKGVFDVAILENVGDFHVVGVLIPFEAAFKAASTFDKYKKWLEYIYS